MSALQERLRMIRMFYFMDESFSALDPLIRKEMQDELLELQDKMENNYFYYA
ncbi:hypothetical protein ACT7CY_23820 [Bacillus pacificus]